MGNGMCGGYDDSPDEEIKVYEPKIKEQTVINMTDKYQTRDGRKGRVLCVDRLTTSEYVVYAAVTCNNLGEEWESIYVYNIEGKLNAWKDTDLDLVPVPKEYWINIYSGPTIGSSLHSTKAKADAWTLDGRIACIKFKEGEGLE